MTLNFDPLNEKNEAISYSDDIKMPLQNKKCAVIDVYHTLLRHTLVRKASLKAALDKTLFFRKKNIFFW